MISMAKLGVKAADIKVLVILFSVGVIFFLLVAFAMFILKALGIYEMSKTLGIKSKWFAFFPFFNDIAFGKLADCGRKNISSLYNKLLIAVRLIFTVFLVLGITMFLINFVDTFFAADKLINDGANITKNILRPLVFPCNLLKASLVFFAIYKLLYLFAFLRVSEVFSKQNQIILFIFAFLLPVLIPVFIFVMRKNKPLLPSAYINAPFSEDDFD